MRSIIFFTSFIFLFSCVDLISEPDDVPNTNVLDLHDVPDGFDYDMFETRDVSVNFASEHSRFIGKTQFQYAIIGLDHAGASYEFLVSHASLDHGIHTIFKKPLHIQQLFLYIKYDGNARFYELTDQQIDLTVDDLIVTDADVEATVSRLAGVPNCTSFLGNATQIRCQKSGVSIKSSASISYIDAVFMNGDTIRTYAEDYAVNANVNQWYFPYEDKHAQADQFLIYASCKSSPRKVSLELVTFANPCQPEATDQDNDTVDNEVDAQPADPNVSTKLYIPAKDEFSTFAFEDMWPHMGDFDFNDLVVGHNSVVYMDADHMVSKVDYQLAIVAIGASFDNSLCVSFTSPIGGIELESMHAHGIGYRILDIQDKTEVRFEHIAELYEQNGFINTHSSSQFVEPKMISFTLLLDRSVHMDDFSEDVYLRINQQEGREVHKPGKGYTSLFDETLIGTAYDDTRPGQGKYFLTADNLPWVLEIPTEWEYPKEQVKITEAYPNFADFAKGKSKEAWYTNERNNKVKSKLYQKKQ
jgi:LruC domain-containing protein